MKQLLWCKLALPSPRKIILLAARANILGCFQCQSVDIFRDGLPKLLILATDLPSKLIPQGTQTCSLEMPRFVALVPRL